jgi:hypothetical protein
VTTTTDGEEETDDDDPMQERQGLESRDAIRFLPLYSFLIGRQSA